MSQFGAFPSMEITSMSKVHVPEIQYPSTASTLYECPSSVHKHNIQ